MTGAKEEELERRKFLILSMKLASLPLIGTGPVLNKIQNIQGNSDAKAFNTKNSGPMEYSKAFESLKEFSLLNALFGRRARRFGLGMEIPSGPLAFKSRKEAMPLSETEQMLLVAAATGVSGWNFGIPFGPRTPDSHAEFAQRFTGRTAPTAAGLGTPAIFYTDDFGCYFTGTRDVKPNKMQEFNSTEESLEHIVSVCRENSTRIMEKRLDLPRTPPHILPPNLWWTNKPGSTLFMPVGDAAEECLGILALLVRHGVVLFDQDTGNPAGNLDPFVRSGMLDPKKRLPLSELQATVYESIAMETAFKGHNIVLMLQAIGLGGLFFNGIDELSVMGARSKDGIQGLGFSFVEDERWETPNPVGLKGIYEALCPPNYPDMHTAVKVFIKRKFGENGAYNLQSPGPWKNSEKVKSSVLPYSQEFEDCLSEIAQYIHDKHGKFPGIRSTVMMPGFVQAHHIDTDFYDKYYKEGAYLKTHTEHMANWHGK